MTDFHYEAVDGGYIAAFTVKLIYGYKADGYRDWVGIDVQCRLCGDHHQAVGDWDLLGSLKAHAGTHSAPPTAGTVCGRTRPGAAGRNRRDGGL